jgi:transcriptional regulator NrdR family protein
MMGELVMEALATLDQVAFNRSASVYRNSREPRISANSSAKSRRMTIDASCHNWFPPGGAGG